MSILEINKKAVTVNEITTFVEENNLLKDRIFEILSKNFGQIKSVPHAIFLVGMHTFESLIVRVMRECGEEV